MYDASGPGVPAHATGARSNYVKRLPVDGRASNDQGHPTDVPHQQRGLNSLFGLQAQCRYTL